MLSVITHKSNRSLKLCVKGVGNDIAFGSKIVVRLAYDTDQKATLLHVLCLHHVRIERKYNRYNYKTSIHLIVCCRENLKLCNKYTEHLV